MRARTVCFMVLAFAQLFHLGTARSTGRLRGRHASNRWALGALGLVIVIQLLAVYVGPLAALLQVTPPGLLDWAVIAALSVFPAVVGQLVKRRRP
jgi:Ca2+-transporting ATPase